MSMLARRLDDVMLGGLVILAIPVAILIIGLPFVVLAWLIAGAAGGW
jgi:hypothetical protein